jgi:hypothetical protein
LKEMAERRLGRGSGSREEQNTAKEADWSVHDDGY